MINKSKWISTNEASKYLAISKSNLYSLVQQDKVPASKVGKKWIFEVEKLDEWLRAKKDIKSIFLTTDFNISENDSLREPQKEGYLRAYDYFQSGGKKAIIQMPVGCGKSGLISLLPFGIAKGRVLVIAPNLTIKEELYRNLDISNKQACFWKRMHVLEDKDMLAGPYVSTLEDGNITVSEKSHIVLTNIQQLGVNTDKWLHKFSKDFFDLIIVDEGHHSAASSWEKVFEWFPEAKVVNLTATPFRSDRQKLDGDLVYRYSFKSASIKGYIKKLVSSSVAPTELKFTLKGEERTYDLEEILKMKEEEWFSHGVALSEPCNISIVDNSLEKLEKLRLTGTKHQLIAVACSINHAQRIRSLYIERGYTTEVIHSNLSEEEKEKTIRDLKNGILDCIVQVQMLGEGFDHSKLSVAAIFRPFRSLAPYIQFVGRIMRVIVQNDPTHPDNYGHIVTHVGLNLDKQLKSFKDFENDDKAFWEEVTSGEEPELPHEVLEGKTRMKLKEDMIVNYEIVEQLFEENFLTLETVQVIKELEAKLEILGLDPSLARQLVEKNQKNDQAKIVNSASAFSVMPLKQWQEAKRRLNEEVNRTAKILLTRCGLEIAGKEIPFKLKTGIGAGSNFIAAIQMVNKKINNRIKPDIRRNEWSAEDFSKAMSQLPNVLEELVRELKKIQKEYDKRKNT